MKILLVEDGRSLAAVMTARLSAFGHDVRHAANGQIAVEVFQEFAPDLILMDIEMPVMNGFEATSRIRASEACLPWAWTPIIFLTATATDENLITAIEAGGDDFMAKSVPEPVLHAKMKAMGRIAQLRERLHAANRKLDEMASRDGLTGLLNRRSMDLRTDEAWEAAGRTGTTFGLLMIDIDNFKKFNDRYGHQAGDECLRKVAGAIAATVAPRPAGEDAGHCDMFAARYGGEEFAIIVPGCERQMLDEIAARLGENVRHLAIPHADGVGGIVTLSIGGTHLPVVVDRIADLFRSADLRLYEAKTGGRDRAVVGTAAVLPAPTFA